jgi:hypothetical protein
VDSTSTDICCCKDTKYRSSINTELSHVLTSDIHILDQFPDLQLLLQKGTAYKQSFCTDIRSNLTIFDDLLKCYIQKAHSRDGLSKTAYDYWLHSVRDVVMAHRLPHENRHNTFQSDRFVKLTTAAAMKQLQTFSKHFIVTVTDKAPGNFAFICKKHYEMKVIEALTSNRYVIVENTEAELSTLITTASKQFGVYTDKLYNRNTRTYSDTPELLPTFFFTLKAHKSPPGLRPIVATNSTAISALSKTYI